MSVVIRPARTADVVAIESLIEPFVAKRILLGKDAVVLYGSIQQFVVAEDASGEVVGCGALHVLWRDLGEIRTVAEFLDLARVKPNTLGNTRMLKAL